MTFRPSVICGENIVDAWEKSAAHITENGPAFNVTTWIDDCCIPADGELRIRCHSSLDSTSWTVFDVANTIFPRECRRWDLSVDQFCSYYARAYERLLRVGRRSWGVYFLRLVEFGDQNTNQLERIVAGIRSWGRNHRAAFNVHFSSSETDRPRPQGGPCLQYVQFGKSANDTLSLAAVYRSQDYYEKALGNYVGLTRLLHYVCQKANMNVGNIACTALYAHWGFKTGATKRRLVELVRRGTNG